MTLEEINLCIKSYQQKEELKAKEILASNYNSAFLIASFVGAVLNGKEIPTISQIYPDQFPELPEPKEEENKAWMIYKEQMLDFAIAHNKKRQRKVSNIDG